MSTLPETTLAYLRQRQESATPPAPELLEANFRAWYKEARGSLYCGAMPLCDAIEWAQHLLQQATPQALVPPAAPATPTPAPAMTYQQRAVVDVLDERRHQDDMWGISNHDPTTWMAILTEAVGKTAQATVQQRFNYPRGTKAWIRIKAVHVAAVALAFIECLDRSQQPTIPLPDHIAKRDQLTTEDQP
jgi:hypothetical protein